MKFYCVCENVESGGENLFRHAIAEYLFLRRAPPGNGSRQRDKSGFKVDEIAIANHNFDELANQTRGKVTCRKKDAICFRR